MMALFRPLIVLAAAALAFSTSAPAQAQIRDIVPEELLQRFTTTGNQIRFCINSASALAGFDRAVANELAEALLLDVQLHDLVYPAPPLPFEYGLLLPEKELFIQITNNCDAVIGYPLPDSDVIPDWLTTTQPYYRPGFVLAFAAQSPANLDELPAGTQIGSRMGIAADIYVRSYVRESAGAVRRRIYPLNSRLVSDLASGVLAAAVVWEPAVALARGQIEGADGIKTVPAPFPIDPVSLAVVMPSNKQFLREALNPAIDGLRQSGRLDELLDQFGLPREAN